jgi:hypothetical protein
MLSTDANAILVAFSSSPGVLWRSGVLDIRSRMAALHPDGPKMVRTQQAVSGKVLKQKPQPMRNIENSNDDHPVGLWIDKELLRKHQSPHQTILHGAHESDGNRYLQLADIALRNTKAKKKSKAAGS